MEERIEKFSNSQTRRESIYNIYKKWKLNEAYDTVTKKMLDKKNSPKNLSTNLKETNLLDSMEKKKKKKNPNFQCTVLIIPITTLTLLFKVWITEYHLYHP